MELFSLAAVRCGLGGRVDRSRHNYVVHMRGEVVPELSRLISVEHKTLSEQVGPTRVEGVCVGGGAPLCFGG